MDIFQMYGIAKPTTRQRDERMTPEEEKQVTESLGKKALGTVGAVGNSLDLPGSVVRDLATWLPGGMKAQNPFDQLLTPFNDSNRVSGRDLNRSYGLAGQQDTWANFAGGMGTEIALDPLTYLTFGGSALGKGGQVAKSAGLLKKAPEVLARRTGRNLAEVGAREARVGLSLRELLGELGPEATKAAEIAAKGKKLNLDDLLDQKLGGNVGINLPFMDPSFTVGGSTKAAAAVDKFARDMRYMTIPGTDFAPINALMNQFQVKTGGMATPLGAKLAEKAFDAKTQNRSQVDLVINKYANQLKDLGYDSATGGRMLRRMMEVEGLRKNAPAEMMPMLDEMRSVLEEMPAIAKDWGINLKEFVDDDLSYFPRQYTREVRNAKGADSARVLNGRQINAARRKEFLRGDGLETESIIKLGQDEDINAAIANGAKASEIADMIKSKYGSEIPEKYKVIAKTGENAGKEVERDRYKALARWLGTLSPEGRKSGIFGNHALYDLQARMVSAGDAKVAAETVVDFLTQPGLLKKTPDGLDKQGMMSVNQVLKRTGLNIGDSTGGIGKQIAIKMGHDLSQLPPEQANKVIVSIGKASIDGKTADEITRFVESFKSPDQASQLLDLVNGASNLWKGALTTPWPSFHVRNLISGQWANASAGLWSADSVKDAVTLTRGGVVKGAEKIPAVQAEWAKRGGVGKLSEKEATKILGEMASAYRVVGKFDASDTVGLGSKIDNQVAHNLDDMISGIPGEGRKSFSVTRTAKKAAGLEQGTSPWKFWANRGVGGRSKSEFGPMAAGEEVGFATEAMNRLSPWLHQIKKGVDPQHAADTVGAIQVQYSNRYYTKAEQQILGNLFPFYKFSRSMVPYLINQVLEHPGGATANTIRTMENAHDPAQFTPDHVRESAAIPINGSPLEAVLGKVPAGHDRYISGLGLPVEELMGFGPSPRAAGLEAMSRLNPAIKAPIEYFTGQSFFQKTPTGGRPLDTMDPPTGRLLANLSGQKEPVRFPGQTEADILLSNSPFSKVISSLNMATDTRRGPVEKAVNMLTGVRTKDVTPATKDTLERDTLNQAMKEFQAKQFTRTYIPDSVRATMTPEQQRQADLYEQMAALLADRAKARKEAAQAEEQQKLRASR